MRITLLPGDASFGEVARERGHLPATDREDSAGDSDAGSAKPRRPRASEIVPANPHPADLERCAGVLREQCASHSLRHGEEPDDDEERDEAGDE